MKYELVEKHNLKIRSICPNKAIYIPKNDFCHTSLLKVKEIIRSFEIKKGKTIIKKGQMVGTHGMIISAIAHGYTLLTSNYNEFSRIAGLEVINTKIIC